MYLKRQESKFIHCTFGLSLSEYCQYVLLLGILNIMYFMWASLLSMLNCMQTSKAEESGMHSSNPPFSSLHTTTTPTPVTKPPVSSPSHSSMNATTARGSSHSFQRSQIHQQQKNAEMTRKKLELHKKTQELLLKQIEQQKVYEIVPGC